MKKRRAEEVTREEILNEYINKPMSELRATAMRLGVSYREFRRALQLNGFKPRGAGKFRTAFPQLADLNWLKKELETKSINQVAKEVGTTSGNLSDFCKRHGLTKMLFENPDRYAKMLARRPRGTNHHNWKGGRVLRQRGKYWMLHRPNHPYATNGGYVMEHRIVMEGHLGRFLNPDEIIHHINGDTHDNRLENLKLGSRKEHCSYHYDAVKLVRDLQKRIKYLESLLDKHRISYQKELYRKDTHAQMG